MSTETLNRTVDGERVRMSRVVGTNRWDVSIFTLDDAIRYVIGTL